eukprot:CAMPEP_0179375750 /NCGR_PEP_ID=MMETSP0797-20121207/87962_1 /TAXON_ID=47934 /ORGANISM="Dinophysis acuminata, Strain DAEP01" /LENGTH=631 /DNA_ID=CAMNT_0021091763 /DNA_START=23 /DNA_END=1915 /DNA_ORIENTATION=-
MAVASRLLLLAALAHLGQGERVRHQGSLELEGGEHGRQSTRSRQWARLRHSQSSQAEPLDKILTIAKMSRPVGWDPVQLSGHFPAIEVYKTPDPSVRVEGVNVGPGDSLSASTYGAVPEAMIVYAVSSRPTDVELRFPSFFLPNDGRRLEVVHQGRVVHSCTMPSSEVCMYKFDYSDPEVVGRRYTVRAVSEHDGSVLQTERLYAPFPYMCAASPFTGRNAPIMDCDRLESYPAPLISDLEKTSKRGFAVELEFMAKNSSMKAAEGGPEALEVVRQCAVKKVAGTEFARLAEIWNWEEEPSMVPFGPRDGMPASEYVGLMAELTSPGPPHVLFGQEGIADVARVFHVLDKLDVQVGLWAQLHVHINVRSAKANSASDCCLSTDELVNIWTAWSKYQMVIDEMQNPTNVDNMWAKPLYMEDLIARGIFANMHKTRGTGLPIEDACETLYGPGNCDSKGHGHWWTPPGEGFQDTKFYHGPPRYYAVNLAPLPVKGTVEIRQNAGTTDTERAQRWIQFVLAFVETFKSGAGLGGLFDEGVEKDTADLAAAQSEASFEELFHAMGGHLDPGAASPTGASGGGGATTRGASTSASRWSSLSETGRRPTGPPTREGEPMRAASEGGRAVQGLTPRAA